ncbi:puratrophin-1-like isoform X2 [Engystomops pustulosus]|uniref:puratrophin-1-like isoform X2 n=1 Tax=Engystomops pustulosus TaxID=76066 RepID=UPI003AFAD89C
MDSQSLDGCIQKTLSSLYHPFDSTAATVLCQVLDVVEKTYRGDGLSYLIDFLIPAKRILQGLQQEACLQYCGLLFRHAGWPLCIHDKIVLQLASIDWRLLQPGDFYLQVVPYLRKTPRIVLKCLTQDQHNIEEVVLPEVSYTSIFTLEWLEFINSERLGASLQNCLLTCDDQLHRVPWDMIVHPEFVEKKESGEIFETLTHKCKESPTDFPVEELMVQDEEAVLEPACINHGHTTANTLDVKSDCSSEIEGEYVDLRDITVPRLGPQKGSLTQSIALNFKSQQKLHQRFKNNQTLSSNKSTEGLIHGYLQPSNSIMGASVTHYDTDRVEKPDSIGLVDIEFGVGESSITDHIHFSFDNGTKRFQQDFNLENESLSIISEDMKYSDLKETDNGRQSCKQQDIYSASLSVQEESRSQFTQFMDDTEGVTNPPQEHVTEHSRTQDSPMAHSIIEDSDQTVPLLPDMWDPQPENTDNVEGSFNTDIVCILKREVTEQYEMTVAEEGTQSGEFDDQSIEVASGIGEGFRIVADVCIEQPHLLHTTFMNGATDGVPEGPIEHAKLPYCHVGHESPPRSPQYTKHAQSPPTQLPLETLHEDAEEEQVPTTNEPPEVIGGVVLLQDGTFQGNINDQEKTGEIAPEKDLSPLWSQGLSSPSVSRKSEDHTHPLRVKDVNVEVLMSGVVYLPGTRDRNGRGLVIINTRDTCWLNPHCNASELGRLLLYFYSTVRRDCRALGLTLLVDARRCSPVPPLFKAIQIVQAAIPNCIHGVLLLTEKDLVLCSERPHGVQFDVLTSAKSLHKHIDVSQLPPTFNGTFPYCHHDWLTFRMKLENLKDSCQDAYIFLRNAIQNMCVSSLPDTTEEASLQLMRFGNLMKAVLEDTRLVTLQTEGGAVLARLRKEESCVTLTEDYRVAVDVAAELYNRVDESVHTLVQLSNQRIQEMELVIDFKVFEERFEEVSGWIYNVGERLLEECSVLEDSLEVLLQTQRQFSEFDGVASEYCRRGQDLLQTMDRWQNLSSPDVQKYMVRLQKCREKVGNFSRKLEECRNRLEKTIRLYQFFDKAYEWALDGMRHLGAISLDDCNSPELCLGALESLEKYQVQHPMIREKMFEEMRELAHELKSEKGVKHWKFAWSKCQEARQVFEKKLEAALKTKSMMLGEQKSLRTSPLETRDQKAHSDKNVSYIQNKLLNSPICGRERRIGRVLCHRPEMDPLPFQASPPGSSASSVSSSSAYRVRKLSLQNSPRENLHFELIHHVPSGSSTPTPSRPMGRRLLRKAQSFDLPGTEISSHGCQRRLSEPARRGNTGVFIKGLEVSSTEIAERSCSPRLLASTDWSVERMLNDRRSSVSSADGRCRSSKLRHIIDEMVTTEREYVRSLWYITENYFPEMDRIDLPQDLRGKRGIIFGNLEKLRDFHSQYFLKELESCCNHPLRVSHCFLRHKDQFGMYALYSKNKPRSDLLLASHGNIFFKNKQRQLGDKMDLASYLLKPIQRMSKYALLLKDLIKECGEAQEQELAYLRAAEEMVKFQLRHGNDLLAMDAIRDCDVNLKEQGQLVKQDEFTVWLGRKKCQRHVFLFEDLILFSKPKRIEGGLDVYIYKRSFKTADIGLTENSGDSGLRFEIWFRRRKSNDTHILQASSAEVKQAWTADIAKILWQQATRNKEIRMQEMVSMGVGNKPFLDIKPSDAAINNRAIDYIMKGRGARTRASIAVSLFDHSDPYKRTQAPITCNSVPSACGPSSTSLLGPLNLHMYVNQTLLAGVLSANRPFETSSCLEEDELENETSCSQPSMTTESSESSHCMSGGGSSGSDSGCVSGIPQDNLSEDAGSPCDASAQYTFPERRNSSNVSSPVVDKPRFINRQYISAV